MTVAGFITAQRADHGIPNATSCRALSVSQAWLYKWRDGDASPRRARRAQLAIAIGQFSQDGEPLASETIGPNGDLRTRRRQSRQKPTVLHHILVMFRQCGAEKMAALRVSHKIEIVRVRRLQRRP